MRKAATELFFMLIISVYSCTALFVFVPCFEGIISRTVLIVFVSVLLVVANISIMLLLRNEHPLIWFYAFAFDVAVVCLLANINNQFFVRALDFYGIYSVYSTETDPVLTASKYYTDALLFATLTISLREMIFVPLYYLTRKNAKSNAKKN